MSQKASTPDERFLIKLFELAKETSIDPNEVATAASIKEKAAKTILKALQQANFVKKNSDGTVFLTPRGLQFVENELRSSR